MIVGSYSLDPRRILTANYEPAKYNLHIFKISYVVGSEVISLTQLGKLKECEEWLKEADSVIGKGPLIDAISSRELDEEDEDDDVPFAKGKIGFN